jgi:hypothetical protein
MYFNATMNEEIKKDRSRNYPKLSLAASVELAKKLYSKAGKAKISPEVAVGALGYSGMNGAALAALGTLTHYGLIDRERGKSVSISPLAIRLIHPLNSEQEIAAKRESALLPQVFKELFDAGFHKCDTALIANHLIQNEFTPDGARKAANMFKENIELAKLQDSSINDSVESQTEDKTADTVSHKDVLPPVPPVIPDHIKGKTVLATYTAPLGSNEATITFTGEKLSVEDFVALADFVDYCKRQFERKQKSESSNPIPPKPAFPEPPFVALWKNSNKEKMVKIVGQPVFQKGEYVYQDDGGTLIPANELFPDLKK